MLSANSIFKEKPDEVTDHFEQFKSHAHLVEVAVKLFEVLCDFVTEQQVHRRRAARPGWEKKFGRYLIVQTSYPLGTILNLREVFANGLFRIARFV